MRHALTALMVFSLVACSQGPAPDEPAALAAPETWTVNSDLSNVSFTTIKTVGYAQHLGGMEAFALPDSIGENLKFNTVSGIYDNEGQALIRIDLNSVDTGLEIRDGRLREHLFQTSEHPEAVIKTILPPDQFASMAVGSRQSLTLDFTLALHGSEIDYAPYVTVTRLSETRVEVASLEPVVVMAEDFGLVPGIDTLRGLANLPAITPLTLVSFSIVFEAES